VGRWGGARRARAAMTVVAGVVVVVTALAPAAGAKKASSTTTSTTSTTVPAAWDPRLQPIVDKVAELRGLTFDHPVAAEFLEDAAYEKQVAVDMGTLTKEDKQDLARDQTQFLVLGLIGPDVNLRDSVESLEESGTAAYYSPKTKKITVRGTTLDDPATRVTVAHELTHALQDQHFDLQKLDKAARTTHGSRALHALAEGDAVRTADAFEKTLSDADQQAYKARQAELGRQSHMEIVAKAVPDSLQFDFQSPYALGPSMLDALVAKEQAGAVDALFANPPVADAVFVTPLAMLEHRTFQTVDPPALVKGEKRSGKPDVFGALALFQVLASRTDNATALSAADAWDGDAMVFFTRKGQSCLRATFAGRGTDGTTTITNALNQWAAQMPAGTALVSGTPDRVTLTACDPGAASAAIPNKPVGSIAYLANRDGFFSLFVKNGDSTAVAICVADTIVRDPVFTPVIDAAANDPFADPDPALVASVGMRLREIRAQCQQSNPS
jgi:hypothetical protein